MEYLYFIIPLLTVIYIVTSAIRDRKQLAINLSQYADEVGDNATWRLVEVTTSRYKLAIYSLKKGEAEYHVSFPILYFRRPDALYVPPTLEIPKEKVIERLCLVKEDYSVKFSRHI